MSLKTRLAKLEVHQLEKNEQQPSQESCEATKQWLNDIIQQLNDNRSKPEKKLDST
ncbi:hypothetical protein [Methylobacter luteus]|uniref:hypothetical protein n=1 Tax=Methylobacter luteus TaxID=415 RepID=UPI0012DEEA32|nr:hypothetical protein [Methylobacter luteus]